MVSWTDPSATDNTGDAPTIVCTPQSGSVFMIGTQDVTCTATDAAGNRATPDCTFTVTVTGLNLIHYFVSVTEIWLRCDYN